MKTKAETKKQKLIEAGKEAGFVSIYKPIVVNNDDYYFWLCDLQKWLRDHKGLVIFIAPLVPKCGEYGFEVYHVNDMYTTENDRFFKSYEKALEAACITALKLI